jgi:hypothetical protein
MGERDFRLDYWYSEKYDIDIVKMCSRLGGAHVKTYIRGEEYNTVSKVGERPFGREYDDWVFICTDQPYGNMTIWSSGGDYVI